MKSSVDLDATPPLTIAVVYQDAVTREWAKQICQRVQEQFGDDSIYCTWWQFNYLNHPDIFKEATHATAEADILVFAVRAHEELPCDAKDLLDLWVSRRNGRESALVALLGRPEQPSWQALPAHEYMQLVTQQSGIDYFPHEFRLPPKTPLFFRGSVEEPIFSAADMEVSDADRPQVTWVNER